MGRSERGREQDRKGEGCSEGAKCIRTSTCMIEYLPLLPTLSRARARTRTHTHTHTYLLLVSDIPVGENEKYVVCALAAFLGHHHSVPYHRLEVRGPIELHNLEAASIA